MSAFLNALLAATRRSGAGLSGGSRDQRNLWTWLAERLRSRSEHGSRLRVLERITVTPRQLLLLIEAEGERLVVATSDGSSSTIYPLDGEIRLEGTCS